MFVGLSEIRQHAEMPISPFHLSDECAWCFVSVAVTQDCVNSCAAKLNSEVQQHRHGSEELHKRIGSVMDTFATGESETSSLVNLLAFIDTFDVEGFNHPSVLEPASCSPLVVLLSSPATTNSDHSDEGVSYSTSFQRRRKREIRGLHLEIDECRGELARLQADRRQHLKIASSESGSNLWRSRAVVALQDRRYAEQVNRKLKEILSSQEDVFTTMRGLLEKSGAIKEIEMLAHLSPLSTKPVAQPTIKNAAFLEIAGGLEVLREEADAMVPVVETSPDVVYRYWHKQHGTSTCMEILSITPFACSLQQAGDFLWGLTTQNNKDSSSFFSKVDKRMPSAADVNIVGSLLVDSHCITSISAYRRYVEADRIVQVGQTRWCLPSGEVLLEDCNWTVTSPSSQPTTSLIRTCYTLTAKNLPARINNVQEIMLSSVGEKLRRITQSMQNLLLSYQ